MSPDIAIENPQALVRYAEDTRESARTLLAVGAGHVPIGPGPDNVLAELHAANERVHQRLSLYATDAYQGLGGVAHAAEYIAVKLPGTDLANAEDLRRIGAEAVADAQRPVAGPRPDPRLVSPAVPE